MQLVDREQEDVNGQVVDLLQGLLERLAVGAIRVLEDRDAALAPTL